MERLKSLTGMWLLVCICMKSTVYKWLWLHLINIAIPAINSVHHPSSRRGNQRCSHGHFTADSGICCWRNLLCQVRRSISMRKYVMIFITSLTQINFTLCLLPNMESRNSQSVPYSAYKERALSKIPTLRSLNNALRQDANRLTQEVDTLSEEIDLLEPEADRWVEFSCLVEGLMIGSMDWDCTASIYSCFSQLVFYQRAAVVEEELRNIAERQQCNVDKLVNLVKENGRILDEMKVSYQVMMIIIRRCDTLTTSYFHRKTHRTTSEDA
jgi:hypothetical protein